MEANDNIESKTVSKHCCLFIKHLLDESVIKDIDDYKLYFIQTLVYITWFILHIIIFCSITKSESVG
jgi:hypothetical protein